MDSLKTAVDKIRDLNPLVHHITNLVSINDCANISLALGASPIMALDPKEVEEICSISQALVLNMGTLDDSRLRAMILAGRQANSLGIPIVLDPVGLGVSSYRRQALKEILDQVQIAVIKGNSGEIKTLAGRSLDLKGVDGDGDRNYDGLVDIARDLSEKYKTVIAITGERDIIVEKNRQKTIDSGSKFLSKITGTGCMTSSLIGGFLGQYSPFEAASLALELMATTGQLAEEEVLAKNLGLGSFKEYLFNNISRF